jgi:hypothetical protein
MAVRGRDRPADACSPRRPAQAERTAGGQGMDGMSDEEWRDRLRDQDSARVSAIEQALVAPWPRRLVLMHRLRMHIRQSVRNAEWAAGTWHDRRFQALADEIDA